MLVNYSSRLLAKDPSLPIIELLEKNVKAGEAKLSLHPLPKHSDPRQHSQHNKSKKFLKSDRLLEHNGEKTLQLEGLSPKTQMTGSVTANNQHHHNHNCTTQKTNQESQSNLGPVQQVEADAHPNSRARLPSQVLPPLPPPSPRRESANRRMDPEENRPGKSRFYQPAAAGRNNSQPSAVFNHRSSLLYQLDILRRGWYFFSDAHKLRLDFPLRYKQKDDERVSPVSFQQSKKNTNRTIRKLKTFKQGDITLKNILNDFTFCANHTLALLGCQQRLPLIISTTFKSVTH